MCFVNRKYLSSSMNIMDISRHFVSYSTVVLYIGIIKVRGLAYPKTSLIFTSDSLRVLVRHIAKPKDIFRSILPLHSYEVSYLT